MIIYFEGLSGVGKTTLIQNYNKHNVLKIPEFIDLPENIYDDYACMKNDELKVQKALENKDKIVFVDRGYLSTLVYGMTRYKLTRGEERVDHIVSWVLTNLDRKLVRPDFYIWLDGPNDLCMERAKKINTIAPHDYWYIDLDEARYWYKRLLDVLESGTLTYKLDGTRTIQENISDLSKIIDENITNKR